MPYVDGKTIDYTNFRRWFIQDPNSREKGILLLQYKTAIKSQFLTWLWHIVFERIIEATFTLNSASGQALWRSQADIIGQQTSYRPCNIKHSGASKLIFYQFDTYPGFEFQIIQATMQDNNKNNMLDKKYNYARQ